MKIDDLLDKLPGEERPVARKVIDQIKTRLRGHYEVVEGLGLGSTSIVLKVADKRLNGLPRALKVARPITGAWAPILTIFQHEVTTLLSINHETIIKVYYKGEITIEEAPFPFFIVDFLEDPNDLVRWAIESHPSMEELLDVLMQVARGLAYLHEHDVIHCDVKPANIFVGAANRALIADLGYAKFKKPGDLTMTGITFTRDFAHPELVQAIIESKDPNANVAKLPRDAIKAVFDLYAFGKTILKVFQERRFPTPIDKREIYLRRYLGVIVTRLLDGENPVFDEQKRTLGIPGLPLRTINEMKYRDMSEVVLDFRKVTNEYSLEEAVPELNPQFPETVQLPGTGRVPFTKRTQILISDSHFSRLAKVSQLGLLSLVYPAATNSRFEHCLGTFANACLYLRALYYDPENPLFRSVISESNLRAALLASLLHDLGQYPLAHDLEDIEPDVFGHEHFTEKLLAEAESLRLLISSKAQEGGWDTQADDVLRIMHPRKPGATLRDLILHAVIDGPIDADVIMHLTQVNSCATLSLYRYQDCLSHEQHVQFGQRPSSERAS